MIFLIESGEYSDFQVHGLVEGPAHASGDTLDALVQEYMRASPLDMTDIGPSGFLAWLVRQPGWREIDHKEYHTGGYGLAGEDAARALFPGTRGWPNRAGTDKDPTHALTGEPLHAWHQWRVADGRYTWRCVHCGEEREP